MKYEPFQIQTDMSLVSLQEAAMHVGPEFVYNLHIHPSRHFEASNLVASAMVRGNPLQPHINIVHDLSLGPYEWYLRTPKRAVGSPGVS